MLLRRFACMLLSLMATVPTVSARVVRVDVASSSDVLGAQ